MSSTNRNRRNAHRDEEAASLLMEDKNNEIIDELDSKISLLKRGATELRGIITEDDRKLNDIEHLMDNASNFLTQSMQKFDVMTKKGGAKMTCYLACFIFAVFFLFYWMLSRKWS